MDLTTGVSTMTKTVLYYNRGTKCINRLVVSIHSLKKHWSGDITLVNEGVLNEVLSKAMDKLGVKIINIPEQLVYPLVVKSRLHKHVNYDMTMFVDADTLILGSVDEYFEMIEKYGFVTGNFCNWKTTGGNISKRIKAWEKAVPELIKPALKYGIAINTGINGWKRENELLYHWEQVCEAGYANKCTTRIVDEIACQLVLPHHIHGIAGVEWGTSVKFGKVNDKTKIIHYHGSKHCGDNYPATKMWKEEYAECVKEGLLTNDTLGDNSLKAYLGRLNKITSVKYGELCTLVTAVNAKYYNKFKINYPLLISIDPLKYMRKIVFAHSDTYGEVCAYVEKMTAFSNEDIKVVEWSHIPSKSMREEMLSAFVFGTAEQVKTKYWIKMDCDAIPKVNNFEIPIEAWSSHVTAHKWGYTKVKHDPGYEGKHWLNQLDDWANKLKDFVGTKQLFNEKILKPRFGHQRIATFFSVEKTAWTKHLAKMCGERMPIPSQDTLTWYCATRLGRKVLRHNFKRYFSV